MAAQAKQLDPDFGMDGEDEDGWDEALGYLDACGPGFHLQIARTASADKNLVSSSVVSNGSDLSNLLIDDSQKEKVCTMTDPEKVKTVSPEDRQQASSRLARICTALSCREGSYEAEPLGRQNSNTRVRSTHVPSPCRAHWSRRTWMPPRASCLWPRRPRTSIGSSRRLSATCRQGTFLSTTF